jgi:hypothetical protein
MAAATKPGHGWPRCSPARTAAAGSCPKTATRCWWFSKAATYVGHSSSARCGTVRTQPPTSADRRNVKKIIKSRNGVVITIEDQDGQEKLRLETPGGCSVTLQDGPGVIEVEDSNGNSVKLEAAGVTVTAAAKVSINASQVEVSAGMVSVSAGMSRFSGVVQADTVITNTIIAATYTPGAGNIL